MMRDQTDVMCNTFSNNSRTFKFLCHFSEQNRYIITCKIKLKSHTNMYLHLFTIQ